MELIEWESVVPVILAGLGIVTGTWILLAALEAYWQRGKWQKKVRLRERREPHPADTPIDDGSRGPSDIGIGGTVSECSAFLNSARHQRRSRPSRPRFTNSTTVR